MQQWTSLAVVDDHSQGFRLITCAIAIGSTSVQWDDALIANGGRSASFCHRLPNLPILRDFYMEFSHTLTFAYILH